MEKRSVYLDVVKGLAIILVVLTHSIQWGSGEVFFQEKLFFEDPLFKFVYGFHMPLFMGVSGYLFLGSVQRHKPIKILQSRLRSLLLPILSSQTLYLLVLLLLGMTVLSAGWIYSYFSALWFLWSVLISSFLTLLGRVAFKDSLFYHIVVLILLLFIPAEKLSALHVFMYPYFVIGYFWNQWNGSEVYNKQPLGRKWGIFMVSFALYVLLSITYDTQGRSVYVNGISLTGRASLCSQLLIDVVRYIYGGLGIVMAMVVVKLFMETLQVSIGVIRQWMLLLGRNTLSIYIFNFFTTQMFLLLPVNSNYGYVLSVVETIIMVLAALAVTWVVRRNKITRLLFLGER